jgi:high-affinity K+ transport system ATPase subunit B
MKHNLIGELCGAFDIFSVAIDVALVFALIPVIKGFISTASNNLTATELVLSALVPLVLILALVYVVAHQTGLMGKKR